MSELFKQDQHVYVQVANLLRSQIQCEQLKEKVPSIRELSKIYSINFKTANKAVSLLVKEGLVHRVKGKGTFVVDKHASKTESPLIGYIVSDIINPNFAYVAQTVQEYAHHKNMSVLVNTTSRQISRLKEIVDRYEKNNVEAIIIQGGAIRDKLSQDMIKQVNIPIIGEHTHLPDIDDVWLDVRAGAQMAVAHLLENFGPAIAYISGSDEPVEKTGRFQGYRDALLSKGYEIEKDLIKEGDPTYLGGYKGVSQFLKEKRKFRSIFLYNLAMAMGTNSAIIRHGLRIPDDIAVAGCDDSVDVNEMLVPTTTIAFSYNEIARQLIALVERRLTHPNAPIFSIRIAPQLVIRESTQTKD